MFTGLFLSILAVAVQADGNRCHLARFELRGPLREVVLVLPSPGADAGARGTSRILADLRAGEVRTVGVPFEGRPLAGPPRIVSIDPPGEGRVEFLDFDPGGGLGHLPPGLRARALPPVGSGAQGVRSHELAWLVAGAVIVLGLRRRPALALTAGLAAALGLLGLRRVVPGAPARVITVLEADLATGTATRVDASAGRLAAPAGDGSREPSRESSGDPIWATTRPRGARLDWTLDLRGGPPGELSAQAQGVLVVVRELAEAGRRGLDPSANTWGQLPWVWTRDGAGSWQARGAWSAGEPLPPVLAAGGSPPGWLASGLPPGKTVLVARMAAEALPGGAGATAAPEAWLRATGF